MERLTKKGRRKLILQTAWVGMQEGRNDMNAELTARQVDEIALGEAESETTTYLKEEHQEYVALMRELELMAVEEGLSIDELHMSDEESLALKQRIADLLDGEEPGR